ncbi:MAG: GNAT family N-acetyltransferase [Enterococcaceae bacterium]|nr:GNAT family N-acetyltransferase [Enterococcaceae bacterium]MCI1919045.1 GNAT family N-acetyltransferase [Enterococcaceae bacterium]
MPEIYIRRAKPADAPRIVEIIHAAKKVLAEEKIPQWQGAYPALADVEHDIADGTAYLLMAGTQIAGTATLFQEPDPNYTEIYQGAWQHPGGAYASIHRIAIDPHYQGRHLGVLFFSNLMSETLRRGFDELRIDTHTKNERMKHLIEKMGFTYAGIVHLHKDPADARVAYQLFFE